MNYSFNIKTCPICKNELSLRYRNNSHSKNRYICSTHLKGTKISHYYVESYHLIQVINTNNYMIRNVAGENVSKIYKLNLIDDFEVELSPIISLPRFSIENLDADKMENKIKILMLFS